MICALENWQLIPLILTNCFLMRVIRRENNYFLTVTKVLSIKMSKTSVSTFNNEEVDEPILTDNEQRFVLFPIKYNDIYSMYKKHVASFWTSD